MADLEDVLNAVYDQVILAVYPNGTSNPSVAGVPVTIIKGWPIKNKLDDALKAGHAIVSIFPTNQQKDITKFERIEKNVSITPATIIITINDLTITIAGTIIVPQSIILTIDGVNYQYTILITDTLNSIAGALAALIPNATVLGAVITLGAAYRVTASIATRAVSATDLGRQEQQFMISCWCPSVSVRTLLAPPIDNLMRLNYQFPIPPDYFNIMIFYEKTYFTDNLQIPLIYRRDLFYKIQYSTTQLMNYTTIAQTITNVSQMPGGF